MKGTAAAGDAVILTPEHVPLRLSPAGLGARFLAFLVDLFVILGLTAMTGFLLRLFTLGKGAALQTTIAFVLHWGYHVFFEVRRNGQSPGKRLCGLRVVDARGLPVTFQQSFVRNVVRVLDAAPLFYGLGGLACLTDPRHRRLGDRAADTLVIQERPPEDLSSALEGHRRFNSLEAPAVRRRIRRLVTLEERELLLAICLRADALDPRARFDLMEEVGGRYRKILGLEDPNLSGENVVRGLLSILFMDRG